MGIRQRKNRRDNNEAAIKEVLEAHGFSVFQADEPADLIVGFGERTYLAEVKAPKGKLTETQREFIKFWRGCYVILRSTEDAAEWAAQIRGSK